MAVAAPDLFDLHAAEFDFDAIKKQNKKIILFVGRIINLILKD